MNQNLVVSGTSYNRSPRALVATLAALSVAAMPPQAHADIWGDIAAPVRNFAQSSANVVLAPAQAAASLLQGHPVDQVAQAYVSTYGQQLQTAGQSAQTLDNLSYQAQAQIASSISPQARWVFDNTTVVTRYGTQLVTTSAQASGMVLQGQDPRLLGTALLAAAMREAYQHYVGQAVPFDDETRNLLRAGYSDAQISNARYVVDPGFSLTLPNVIGNFQAQIGGGEYGVTIGNLIIFHTAPTRDWNGFGWIAHEMEHTVQYSALGIDNFALQYSIDHMALENDANNHAMQTVANLQFAMMQQQMQPHY